MNDSNKLFIVSTIIIFTVTISINYNAISDYYEYSIPLNKMIIESGAYSDDPDIFVKTSQKDDATCYTTPNGNLFCYEKPRMNDDFGVSYVRGENGIQGELHFDPISKGPQYFTIKGISLVDKNKAKITLADKDYSIPILDTGAVYSIKEKFEFSTVIESYDVFISHCRNYEGTIVTIVQYLGITTIDDVEYFMTWHTPASIPDGIECNYPQIMQYSLHHNFKEL